MYLLTTSNKYLNAEITAIQCAEFVQSRKKTLTGC